MVEPESLEETPQQDRRANDVERLELELLCEAIYRHYGSDFRSYASASLMRRVWLYG